jgi:hypothetical protein
LITDGHAAAMPELQRAADAVPHLPVQDVVRWGWFVGAVRSACWAEDAIAVYERPRASRHLSGVRFRRSRCSGSSRWRVGKPRPRA